MRIKGTGQDDVLNGTVNNDTIRGLGGDDTIYANGGADRIYGGNGNDEVFVKSTASTVYGGGGDDHFIAQTFFGTARTFLDGGNGNDEFDASKLRSRDQDTIFFLSYDDSRSSLLASGYELKNIDAIRLPDFLDNEVNLEGLTTAITVFGNRNFDIMESSREAASYLHGGGGSDSLYVRATGSRAYGDRGNDTFTLDAYSGSADLKIDGGKGVDRIIINSSNVDLETAFVISNEGVQYDISNIESAYVRDASDGAMILGTEGDNNLVVESLNAASVTIDGRGGNDEIFASFATDTIYGGDGDDSVLGELRNDTIDGGLGNDTVSFDLSAFGTLDLKLTTNGASVVTEDGRDFATLFNIENVVGSYLNDRFVGDGSGNSFFGGDGDDRLKGAGGDDVLCGDNGSDTLTGGSGSDQFVFRSANDSGVKPPSRDIVTDFSKNEGDHIALKFDADTNTSGVQTFSFIGQNTFSGNAGELRFEEITNNTLVSADVDGDAVADFQVLLKGTIALEVSDFVF